jgi:hypothetical protein
MAAGNHPPQGAPIRGTPGLYLVYLLGGIPLPPPGAIGPQTLRHAAHKDATQACLQDSNLRLLAFAQLAQARLGLEIAPTAQGRALRQDSAPLPD